MKISVIIPAYNVAATVRATLDSVLSQTVAPFEILVFNDGSQDATADILATYGSRITVFHDSNHGLAYARNFTGMQAKGDVLAFLDSDDLWHPRYLETQAWLMQNHPEAVACFTEHENFIGLGGFTWPADVDFQAIQPARLQPLELLKQSNQKPLHFQMSGCCVPKRVFSELGPEPFQVSGVEDTFFNALLSLTGPVVHTTAKPVAYRITEGSLSANRLIGALRVLEVFRLLEDIFEKKADGELQQAFKIIHAARRRYCAKYLMGSGRVTEARALLRSSLKDDTDWSSRLKSLVLLSASCLPAALQPAWPPPLRQMNNLKKLGCHQRAADMAEFTT